MKQEHKEICDDLTDVIKKCASIAKLHVANCDDTASLAKASLEAAQALQIIHSIYDDEL
jgi:hypothetical protein